MPCRWLWWINYWLVCCADIFPCPSHLPPPSPPSLFPSAHFPHSIDFQLKFFAFSGSSPWLGHAHTSLHSCHKQYHRYSLALPSSWDCPQVQVEIVTRFRCFWHNLLIGPKDCVMFYIWGSIHKLPQKAINAGLHIPYTFRRLRVCGARHMPHC